MLLEDLHKPNQPRCYTPWLCQHQEFHDEILGPTKGSSRPNSPDKEATVNKRKQFDNGVPLERLQSTRPLADKKKNMLSGLETYMSDDRSCQ
jgi:hypothetical protein